MIGGIEATDTGLVEVKPSNIFRQKFSKSGGVLVDVKIHIFSLFHKI